MLFKTSLEDKTMSHPTLQLAPVLSIASYYTFIWELLNWSRLFHLSPLIYQTLTPAPVTILMLSMMHC